MSCVLCYVVVGVFFCKQKTAYEMRISDWSSDVCSSDLISRPPIGGAARTGPEAIEHETLASGIVCLGVGSCHCRSSPFGGGGPCEAWWRGTRGVSCPLYT